jgi:hypothetical protein
MSFDPVQLQYRCVYFLFYILIPAPSPHPAPNDSTPLTSYVINIIGNFSDSKMRGSPDHSTPLLPRSPQVSIFSRLLQHCSTLQFNKSVILAALYLVCIAVELVLRKAVAAK